MKEADYISRTDPGDPEIEFENLRKVGIEEIQRLSGNQWTDYNLHDPGVTILEQLCFAITELGYKTAFNIKDLLASQHVDLEISSTFFSAAQILEGKPITIKDYRKLLIDRVEGLRDVWIEPVTDDIIAEEPIKGICKVSIKPSPEFIKTGKDKEKLLNRTREYLEKYSNLGEAFDDIEILNEVEIIVIGEIELKKEANVDETHARVILDIKNFISGPIKFYSLDQMLEQGYSVEEIFNGPRLNNGFIKDEDLGDKKDRIITSHLINIINNVEGVSKVKTIEIVRSDHSGLSVKKDEVTFEKHEVPVMAVEMLPHNSGYHKLNESQKLKYYRNDQKLDIFLKNASSLYRQFKIDRHIEYTTEYQPSNDITSEKGGSKPIADYYSIQEHFPAIYATGSQGIPPAFDPIRINQVKQLKAYLLIFEQILTNYLAQLANFSRLFSLDVNLSQTYFPGSLETVPYIQKLLIGLKDGDNDDEVKKVTREISEKALKTIEKFDKRRNQVLDHLLARFGEKVSDYGFERFKYYYDDDSPGDLKISAKINYLKELVFMSSNRARSFNLNEKYWTPNQEVESDEPRRFNISYVEKKAKIKLGIRMPNIRISDFLKEQVKSKKILDFFLVNRKALNDDFDSEIENNRLLLRRGIWADNYFIEKNEVGRYVIKFAKKIDSPDKNKRESNLQRTWEIKKNEFQTREDAKKFIGSVNEYLTELNIKMEGFYLIDHIELRPRRYGLIVKNFKQNVGFKSKLQSYAVIQKTRENIKKYGELLLSYANKGKFVHEVLENGEFQTQLVYKEVIIGTYLNLVPGRNFNKSDRESELKSLFTLITEAGNQKLFSTQIYSKSIIPEEVTDRTFYSFRVSVIVPEWPSRFADPEYHEWLESIFREDAPAHIWIDFHYLDFTKMDQFENLFENWLKECKDSFYDKNRSSNALAIFIKNLESSKINSFHYNE